MCKIVSTKYDNCLRHTSGTIVLKENPADIPARGGADPRQLNTCRLWLHGPIWLQETESYNQCDVFDKPNECTLEMKQPKKTFTLLTPVNQVKEMQLSAVIDPSNFSSKQHRLQVTAQVLKCALFWKHNHE